jgi:pSer/pThr/pTyr-binding forkhead associated (FHA) protein
VSRRHCSVEKDAGRIILRDHSRYGTRLNGHLIDGSAVLQAGDVIAIGNPSREFRVVLEVDADGA